MDHMAAFNTGSQNALKCSKGRSSSISHRRVGYLGSFQKYLVLHEAAVLPWKNHLPRFIMFIKLNLCLVLKYRKAPHVDENANPKNQGNMCAHTAAVLVQSLASSKNTSDPTQERGPIHVFHVASPSRPKATCINTANLMRIE